MDKKEIWAILKRIDGNSTPEIFKLYKNKYSFGRTDDCDFIFKDNTFLSSKHCYIEKDKLDDKIAWLIDQSTNGSLLNFEEKIHKNKKLLCNNDLICLVYRKKENEKNIMYRFKYMSKVSNGLEATQVYNFNEELNTSFSEEPLHPSPISKINLNDSDTNISNKKIKLEEEKSIENISKKLKKIDSDKEISDNMTCPICDEIIHDCVSLQPCLHSYCSGCYSDWMIKSNECPICRKTVERISKNHILKNIIEAYLKNNPDKKRSEEEIKLLDSKNKIKEEVILQKDLNNIQEEIFDSEHDSENESDDENHFYNNNNNNFNFVPVLFNNYNLNRVTCRQCPQNRIYNQAVIASNYTCTLGQNHLLCQCCLEAFPDRSRETVRDPSIPKQNCSMCFKSYCNLYWGCKKLNCKKCLFKFNDFNIEDNCLINLINDNLYESKLFSDWLIKSNKSIQQVFNECIDKLKNGLYKIKNMSINETLDKVVCLDCALSLFKEFAYQYRRDIPKNDFKNNNEKRQDCYWGRECRTQKHKQDHAKKFNHICERTKF